LDASPEAIAAYEAQVLSWTEQYGKSMQCPVTGLVIPKDLRANLEWRKQLRDLASDNPAVQEQIRTACSASFVYWINAFGFTYWQKWVNEEGVEVSVTGDAAHVPFLTWKIQDDAALTLISCIERGEDSLIDKSRDMGASWLVIAVFQWMFQFRPNSTFLEVSRKEMYVDQRGNMDSLMEKHRYMMRMQPVWLRPKKLRDNTLLLENQDNGSVIIGESTNDDVGQGGRKTAILLDEFARVKNGEEIDLATADTAACRIFNSTVNGPATWYTRIYRDLKDGTRQGVIITLPWEAHPAKGAGLSIIDVPVSARNKLGKKAVSKWYIHEQQTRSVRDLSQNIDRDHGKSGDAFFDSGEIEAHRLAFQREPESVGNISWDDELNEDEKRSIVISGEHESVVLLRDGFRHRWKLWMPLVNGRPDQSHSYVFGVDISMGTGSSNSVVSVLDNETGQKVAEFADSFTSPEDLAWVVSLAGVWFGGQSGKPFLIWESNGPGSIFGKKILQIGYSPIYFAETEGRKTQKTTDRYGWNSNAVRKEVLLGLYRDAVKNGRYINPSKESLDEAISYVYNDRGLLVPSLAKSEIGGASATHGDRVIADALCELGRKKLPEVKSVIPAAPANSFAARRKEFKDRQGRDADAWRR
jgi:hypothetical protein